MRLISSKRLLEATSQYPNVLPQVSAWVDVVKSADWQGINDIRQQYPSADQVESFVVFNVKGNQYRLIVSINYRKQIIFFKYFLTHAEYDKEKWKNDPHFRSE